MTILSPRLWIFATALAMTGAAMVWASTSVLQDLAGSYTHRFKNGDIDGGSYSSTDIVEIFPIDRDNALVQLQLSFFNYHSCFMRGDARLEGQKLVLREKVPGEPECSLSIWTEGQNLRWEDAGTCDYHCGSRGHFSDGKIALSSRRVLKTLPPEPVH
jgi:hypothetical protein